MLPPRPISSSSTAPDAVACGSSSCCAALLAAAVAAARTLNGKSAETSYQFYTAPHGLACRSSSCCAALLAAAVAAAQITPLSAGRSLTLYLPSLFHTLSTSATLTSSCERSHFISLCCPSCQYSTTFMLVDPHEAIQLRLNSYSQASPFPQNQTSPSHTSARVHSPAATLQQWTHGTQHTQKECASPALTCHGAAAADDAHGSAHSSARWALLLLIVGFNALGSRLGAVLAQRQQPVLKLLHNGRLVLQRAVAPSEPAQQQWCC